MITKSVDYKICRFYGALFLRAMLLLSPIMLLFYQENGLSIQELFFFQGIFYLASIIFEFPIGFLSDNFSRKNLLIFSFSIFLGIVFLWMFFKGFYVILFGEIMFGLSKVIMDNATSCYLYDYLSANDKQNMMPRYYGYLNFFLAAGTCVAAIIGTYIYSTSGFKSLLFAQSFLILVSIFLIFTLPNIKTNKDTINNKFYNFFNISKDICKNKNIKYYMFFSGLLTAISILFATSFQPLMQNALFPIALFGVVAFANHGTRMFSGLIAGKLLKNINIKNLVVPLFLLHIIGFCIVFTIIKLTIVPVITVLLLIICLIICLQLTFTILHISRLHKFISIDKRGNLMSINNFISRTFAFIILISSKMLITRLGLQCYFGVVFCIYLLIGSYIIIKLHIVKDLV
ncbi:MAG: MFS transporter [Candidatus Gastranaerophilaceae bacterium]